MSADDPGTESARDWIYNKFHIRPADETFDAIADFTVIWNIFEKRECNNAACDAAFIKVINAIDTTAGLSPPLLQALDFWRKRYDHAGELNESFDHLFSKPERKDFVRDVLLGKRLSPDDQLHALIYIVYRLRNNLFHGPKDFYTLDDQVSNFRMGIRVLRSVFEMHQKS